MRMSSGRADEHVWAIVLAGGDGQRMQSLVSRWLDHPRPKQYCTFVGSRSMFQHTLDRAARITSPERVVTVVARHHRQEVAAQIEGRSLGPVIYQPVDRDTVAGVFLPLTYVRVHDPDATVVLFPSDHFVHPEQRFLSAVQRAIQMAQWLPDRLVLLGAEPDRLELEYGWMLLNDPICYLAGEPVRGVRRFIEKPTPAEADEALRDGALWSTLVCAVRAELLWMLGWRCFPDLMLRFERFSQAVGRAEESHALEEIYETMPSFDFSADFLQRVTESSAVIRLRDVLWSDWGNPLRVTEVLRRVGRQPAFPLTCLDRPLAPLSSSTQQCASA